MSQFLHRPTLALTGRRKLADLPSDILFRVLGMLSVTDILRVERVCKILKSVVCSRHLWLMSLRSLDQPCAPNLPSYVDISRLSYEQLRSIVTKTMRWYEVCKKGLAGSRDNIIYSTPLDIICPTLLDAPNTLPVVIADIQLVPGGKYLISRTDVFAVVNICSGKCVCKWRYHADLGIFWYSKFSIESLSEDSFLVFHIYPTQEDYMFIFDLFRVDHLVDGNGCAEKIATTKIPSRHHLVINVDEVTLGEGFGVALVKLNLCPVYSFLIWNLSSGQCVEVTLHEHTPEEIRIAAGRLFFILKKGTLSGSPSSIESFHLDQIGKLQTAAVSYESLERHSVDFVAPSMFDEGSPDFKLAVYHPTSSDTIHEVQIVFLESTVDEISGDVIIKAHWFLFNLHHADAPYHFLRHSTPKRYALDDIIVTSPRTGQSVFTFLNGSHPSSGPPQPLSGGLEDQASEKDRGVTKVKAWLCRLSENKEVFFSPLFEYDPQSGLPGALIDETSSAIVRLTRKADGIRADTYYVR